MAKGIGKNTNTSNEPITATISVDSTTAVTLVSAQGVGDAPHQTIEITNAGNRSLYTRRYAAALDNLARERRIAPGETAEIVKNSDIYTGEISGIFESGGAKDVYVVVQ